MRKYRLLLIYWLSAVATGAYLLAAYLPFLGRWDQATYSLLLAYLCHSDLMSQLEKHSRETLINMINKIGEAKPTAEVSDTTAAKAVS
jgi:hypothetical protein